MTAKSILELALKLPRGQRLMLAERLLDSAMDRAALAAGAAVAEERWRAFRDGRIGAKPVAEVINRLRERNAR